MSSIFFPFISSASPPCIHLPHIWPSDQQHNDSFTRAIQNKRLTDISLMLLSQTACVSYSDNFLLLCITAGLARTVNIKTGWPRRNIQQFSANCIPYMYIKKGRAVTVARRQMFMTMGCDTSMIQSSTKKASFSITEWIQCGANWTEDHVKGFIHTSMSNILLRSRLHFKHWAELRMFPSPSGFSYHS